MLKLIWKSKTENFFNNLMSYSTQKKFGTELNKIYEEDLLIHDWYRFVLSYPPHLVKEYLKRFDIGQNHCVLDPFCGTGTTLIECKKLSISSIGIEANPVVHLMAETKTNWHGSSRVLAKHAEQVATESELRIKNHTGELRTLSEEKLKLIINESISPAPLHKALILIDVINELSDINVSNYERTAFAKSLVSSFSNLRFGPEVGVSKKKKIDVNVVDIWLNQVRKMASDLELFNQYKNTSAIVHQADSRCVANVLQPESIDSIITSPPYPNEKDYSRTTRLESVLLSFTNSKQDLRNQKEGLLRSNTRNVYKHDTDEKWIANNGRILELADSIERRRIELEKTSGFEKLYHKVVKLYFGGMARHLEDLKPKLRPGAQLAYVVGDQASYFRILIPTGELLAEVARAAGYQVTAIDLFRTRISTSTQQQLREEVVILKWNG